MKLPNMFWCGKIIFLSFFVTITLFDTRVSLASSNNVADYACSNEAGYYPSHSMYVMNLNTVLSNLKHQASKARFGTHATGEGRDRVHGLYHCRGDLNFAECHECIEDASTTLATRCPSHKEAMVWYAECTLRYANRSLNSIKQEENPSITVNSELNYSNPVLPKVFAEMKGLVQKAAYDNSSVGYAVAKNNLTKSETLYYLVQCTPDIVGKQCETCLESALKDMKGCCGTSSKEILVFFPSCNIRYSYIPFLRTMINHTSPTQIMKDSHASPKEKRKSLIVNVVVPVVATAIVLMMLSSVAYWFYKRKRKVEPFPKRQVVQTLSKGKVVEIRSKGKLVRRISKDLSELNVPDSVQFNLEVVRDATNNFSDNNKLGEGGFGSVYKGILSNGQEIAVKRLSTYSRQGFKEFKAEVLIVVKLQHKNLVRLLGFCIEEEEQLLVYEFLPNSSLDRFLFDPRKRAQLDWQTRYRIILGIARGLMYLHEDSRLTIVHRDLKCGNILLDHAMNPKIADFGMARLFGDDQIHASTKIIVGTYGYMAPEYALHGHYSVKSDVYSFGMMVLEILSGQRSTIKNPSEQGKSLLHSAWKSWNSNQLLSLVDTSLSGNFSAEEAIKLIHIGLLCVQEEAARRPTMSRIVNVINGNLTTNLPKPAPPLLTQPIGSRMTSSSSVPSENPHIMNAGSSSQELSNVSGTDDISVLLPR